MKKNILRELLNEGKPTIGVHMVNTSPQIVEMIGRSGVIDYIEFVGEYASWGLEDLENFARTVELFPHMSSMMKVEPEPRVFITTRALDAGIQNVLFADCQTAEEVRECVRAVRPSTPQDGGYHTCTARRSVGYGLEAGSADWAQAQRETVIAIMIENAPAMKNLEEILSVEGVDMVNFGPCDYALSIGKPGGRHLPEVKKKEREMIELALKKGIHPRVDAVGSIEEAREFIEMGVRHFCIGIDLRIIYEWCRQNGEGLRKMLAGK